MRKSELLADIDPGSDVAESDTHLQNYFVQTNVFREVVEDHADLIIGPKGSGKTAIFRMLSEPQFDIPDLRDTIVMPAFNTQGSVFFQDLAAPNDHVTEPLLRRLWTAYILSVAGNHVIDNFPASSATVALRDALSVYGLLEEGLPARSIWRTLLTVFRRLTRPSAIEGRVDLGDGLGGLETRLEYDAANGSDVNGNMAGWMSSTFDADRLTQTVLKALEERGKRCWIVFDRLDEAFQDNRTLERIALRGLMRAHIDISSYGPALRTKLFLRSDVLDRITQDAGFVNITHLRSLQISWTRQHILDIIVKRFTESLQVLHYLHHCKVDEKDDVVPALMSPVVEVAKRSKQVKKTGPFAYIIDRTMDASQELNPRNVVSYMRAARAIELTRCQFADVELFGSPRPPITKDTMIKAWQMLSKDRLIDTLYAEYNSLRSSIERFRNGPQRFDREWVSNLFGIPVVSPELAELISSLEYCGFLRQTGRGIYRIPDLYRPALGLNPKWEDRSISGAYSVRPS